MSHNFNDIRIETFKTRSTKVQYLYNLVGLSLMDVTLAEKFLTTSDFLRLRNVIGDIILGFYKIEDTVPLLQQELGIDPRTAALLGADVLEFLAPLSDPNWQPPTEEEEVDTPSTTTAATITSTPIAPISTEPEPLRTMRSDMDEAREQLPSYQPTAAPEPVYQSSQPALSSVPSYTTPGNMVPNPTAKAVDSGRPRWSSEV
jgi:hypothetical protein